MLRPPAVAISHERGRRNLVRPEIRVKIQNNFCLLALHQSCDMVGAWKGLVKISLLLIADIICIFIRGTKNAFKEKRWMALLFFPLCIQMQRDEARFVYDSPPSSSSGSSATEECASQAETPLLSTDDPLEDTALDVAAEETKVETPFTLLELISVSF